MKLIETQLRDLKVEHEVLLQAFEKVSCQRHILPLMAAWRASDGTVLMSRRFNVSATSC